MWKDRSNPPPDDSSDSDNDDCELEYDVYGWFNFDDDKEGVRRLDRQYSVHEIGRCNFTSVITV